MERPQLLLTVLGVAVATLGFIVMGAAWDGAAEVNAVPAQFPYLLSGGLVGLGLVVVGALLLVVQQLRRDAQVHSEELERLRAAVAELAGSLLPPDPYDPARSGEFRPRPRAVAASTAPATTDGLGLERRP